MGEVIAVKEYVPIFFDWVEVTGELNAQEKGRLIDAIVLYAQGGDWQEQIKGNERYLFPAFRKQIDRANGISEIRSNATASRRNQNESNGIKTNQTASNAIKTDQNESNDIKTPNNNNNNNNNKKEEDNKNNNSKCVSAQTAQRFAPPTVEEVRAYCQERRNKVDPEKFVDFYTAKGWLVGKNRVKDWKAAVRTWERDESPARSAPAKVVTAQQYEQRDYSKEPKRDMPDWMAKQWAEMQAEMKEGAG